MCNYNDQVKEDKRLAGNVARGEKRGMHTDFGEKAERKRLGRPRLKSEDNTEIARR